MARKRGFLGRVADSLGRMFRGLGNLLGGGESDEEPPSPPPGPRRPPGPDFFPPPPPPPEPPRSYTRELEIWREITKGNDRLDTGLMDEWYTMYSNAVDPLQLDESEFYQFWRDFLRSFYLTTHERNHILRETFWRRLGIRKRDRGRALDWETWRSLKRGS